MVSEDFTGWSETDPDNRLTQTATRSTFTALDRGDGLTYLTFDYGADEIETFFVDRFTLLISDLDSADATNNVLGAIFGISNNAADPTVDPHIRIDVLENGADDATYYLTLDISEVGGDSDSTTISATLDVGTIYYLQLVRTTFGDLCKLSIYSDATYETLVEAITAEVFEFDDTFRYMFAPWKANYGTDVNDYMTGYIQDLVLGGASLAGLYIYDGNAIIEGLGLVGAGSGVSGVGGVPRVRKGGVTYDLYLVDRGHAWASQIVVRTSTNTKHVSKFIPGETTEDGLLLEPALSYVISVNDEDGITLTPIGLHYEVVTAEQDITLSPSASHIESVTAEQEVIL